jgi:NTE family protein
MVYSGIDQPADRLHPRQGSVALCLSGGGFRASLFHLGALRRLNELGILGRVDTISSVSGGSIIAAHLAKVIHENGSLPTPTLWEEKVSAPFFKLTGKGIRTSIILKKYLPWNAVLPRRRVRWLEDKYDAELTGGMMLSKLPDRPRFLFCATDLCRGDTWTFSRDRVGSHRFDTRCCDGDMDTFPVARAAAASSCFPPIFGPLKLAVKSSRSSNEEVSQSFALLSDGGVRDNMGVDPVWETCQTVIVSDGGAPFRFSDGNLLSPSLWRALAVAQHQSSSVRKTWLISQFRKREIEGTYWGIASEEDRHRASLGEPAYSRALAEEWLSRIRTDLNAFSQAEHQILENHGYMLANAASKAYLPGLIECQSELDAPCVPHREWFGKDAEKRICEQLRSSHRRIGLPGFSRPAFDQPLEGEA